MEAGKCIQYFSESKNSFGFDRVSSISRCTYLVYEAGRSLTVRWPWAPVASTIEFILWRVKKHARVADIDHPLLSV